MLITFAELNAEVAAFHAAEAARNTPSAIACRALETLREALAEMSLSERGEVVDELRALVDETMAESWERFSATTRSHSRKADLMATTTETWMVDCTACGRVVAVPAAESSLPPFGWAYLPVVGGGRD